jgi:hypothetical protein
MARDSLFPAHDRAGILKDEFARADRSQRKDAATVNARAADSNSFHQYPLQ